MAEAERRLAVVDLGSNSFRLVVFSAVPGSWWKLTDEIFESVRIGAGAGESGELQPEPMERALHTVELFVHFCKASGLAAKQVRAVATSAIRDAANRDEFLARAREAGLEVEVLSREEEARYAYLAAVNSTTLADGAVLDLGGGSLQLVEVRDRHALEVESWPLGTVRMTERFLPDERASKKQLKALRAHLREQLATASWLAGSGPRLTGIGGTVRNLAAAAMRATRLPPVEMQGFRLTRDTLADLRAELADRPVDRRGALPGIKPERGDIILAGAAVIETVLEVGDFDAIEVTEAGLREGIFFSDLLASAQPPLFEDVREASVRNLANQYGVEPRHTRHVAALALGMWDALAAGEVHAGEPAERELLWAAAMLHDIGVSVDYDDHHHHSRYLILNASLPGFDPRELALIAQMARYHRKGTPDLGELEPLMREGDEGLLRRCSAVLRLAEQLERSRDQSVRSTRMEIEQDLVRLALLADGDVSVARWGAERQRDLFEQAFGRGLELAA